MTTVERALLTSHPEGFLDIDGRTFYVIPRLERLDPFLMSLVSDSDQWCFISSAGALTAGRRDANTALFPYETDDRLHTAAGITGPVTIVRTGNGDAAPSWEPFGRCGTPATTRAIAKSVLGDQVIFEEVNEALGLAIRFRWATSERFGLVRSVRLRNIGAAPHRVQIVDGLVNLLPAGLHTDQYREMSNLTNAYRRSERVGPSHLALHTLEALIVDRAIPAESLRATVTWSTATGSGDVTVDGRAVEVVRRGESPELRAMVTGRPGAHLVVTEMALAPNEESCWHIVADVAQDHSAVAALRAHLAAVDDIAGEIDMSLRRGAESLAAKIGAADGFQTSGDVRASAHHTANVLFNVMRGGVFASGYRFSATDFRRFVRQRNVAVAQRCAAMLEALPDEIEHRDLVAAVAAGGDADLERLGLEYLPLTFSRRHGDPSRPWNRFSIRVSEADGSPILRHEGNWRDIFQNWEALCMSFPEYLPSVIAAFVNASTADGFNPYRITREGIEWEIPDPDDPWSNIGYWGDHQIVYLLRLLELTDRLLPGAIDGLLDRDIFTYADVPYRLKAYADLVADPRATIEYDDAAARRTERRVEAMGGDGKLLIDGNGDLCRVSLLEKLVVPALSKLSNYVPDGGIWMNTQRPEWNDANNALAGHGLSMVTLCHLRRYLSWLAALTARCEQRTVRLSGEVAGWLAAVTGVLETHGADGAGMVDDGRRAVVMGALGGAFSDYRARVNTAGLGPAARVGIDAIQRLCTVALHHLDAAIRNNRRPDGLYHSYNLLSISAAAERVSVDRLPAMLEGQVAALSAGILEPAESAGVIDALYASALYRPDQDSFLLYPDRRLPSFLDKNLIPRQVVAANPLLEALLATGDTSILTCDVRGEHHFSASLRNAGDLEERLVRLAADDEWRRLVAAHGADVIDAYEEVFHHHAFTGRSGTMYAYEGLGSVYWHMVAKLLVATQECLVSAHGSGASPETLDRLRRAYFRIRQGIGFNKTAAEFGAFPTDPYSHTPAHAGAQQPGMTGQVKEEILTRYGELGVWFDAGELRFDPVLLRPEELLQEPRPWTYLAADGQPRSRTLPPGALGLTVCQVPVVVTLTDGIPSIRIERPGGSVERIDGERLGRAVSREIFARAGSVDAVLVSLPRTGA